MTFYSTLGKFLITTLMMVGGFTGTVLGSADSKEEIKSPVANEVFQNNNSVEGQNSDLSTGSSSLEDVSRVEPKKEGPQLDQSSGRDESTNLETDPQVTAEVSPAPVVYQGEESTDPEQENDLQAQKHDLDVVVPLAQERDIAKPLQNEEKEDWTNKNWFLTRWDVSNDDLDGSAWTNSECTPNIKGEDVTIECPCNGDNSKMVELHLSLSSDEDLKNKNWANLEELTFTGKVGKLATLDLIFYDDQNTAVTVFIYRRSNI